jgi:serine/threonine protein kinase
MFSPVLQLLDELQEHAMVHRDITPQNLMFTKQGGLQLIDFNLGKMAGQAGLTGNGVGGGSGRFASPEQRASLAEATPAADVYGLGVYMIEAAIGQSIRVYQQDGSDRCPGTRAHARWRTEPRGPIWSGRSLRDCTCAGAYGDESDLAGPASTAAAARAAPDAGGQRAAGVRGSDHRPTGPR